MKRQVFTKGLALAGVVGMLATGCATMQPTMSKEEAITARIQLMKEQGAAMRSIGDKMKAGQVQAVVPDAEKLRDTAKQIARLFPEGSLDAQKSRAKPEIWQKWSEFEAAAKKLETEATKLADTAKTGNAQATNAIVTNFGRQACGACHTPFRGPEIKK